jgi:hypothetical protein
MLSNNMPKTFRVIWQRVGATERFRHLVAAETPAQARDRSNVEIAAAFGPNIDVWEIVAVARVTHSDTPEPISYLL